LWPERTFCGDFVAGETGDGFMTFEPEGSPPPPPPPPPAAKAGVASSAPDRATSVTNLIDDLIMRASSFCRALLRVVCAEHRLEGAIPNAGLRSPDCERVVCRTGRKPMFL
jgi:hypothetical protein